MSDKQKHLEFIQDKINSTTHHSFLLRGWSMTLFVALMYIVSRISAVNYSNTSSLLAYILICALLVVVASLDVWLLKQIRLFGDLYNDIRKKKDDEIDFSMDTLYIEKKYQNKTWFIFDVYSRKSILFTIIFYGLIISGLLWIFTLLGKDYL